MRLYPLFHPAAALYTRSLLDTLRADFARLPALLARGTPAQPERAAPPAPAVPEPEVAGRMRSPTGGRATIAARPVLMPVQWTGPLVRPATERGPARDGPDRRRGLRGLDLRAATWERPSDAGRAAGLRARFHAPDVWALIALEADGRRPGTCHCSTTPRIRRRRLSVAAFRASAHQGSGLAVALHDAFLDAARARGYATARLRTPAGRARARRRYEREGWTTDGRAELHPLLGST